VSILENSPDAFADEPDEGLVARVLRDEHDPRAFETLVRRHQGFVVANCRVISRSPADAEDLAQEVFVKAWFGLPRFEQRAQFRTWLRRIKVNHCLNFVRKSRGAVLVDVDEPSVEAHADLVSAPVAEERLHADDTRERIVRVLDTMSDTLRVPLMLCDADGLSYDEIAEQLGIGLSAVKMRIKRGREEFRRRWDAIDPDRPTADLS
jgi:RNA polymerase sigma-70 factor, ECF subfamily